MSHLIVFPTRKVGLPEMELVQELKKITVKEIDISLLLKYGRSILTPFLISIIDVTGSWIHGMYRTDKTEMRFPRLDK